MKVAILSDIHSNLEALNACLSHAKSHGAERYVFLGDLVGYGADPVACLDIIVEHALRGAVVLLGNHDAATISGRYDEIEPMNFVARDVIYWTRSQLRPDQRTFLQGLPLTERDGHALYAHAGANEPSRWRYVTGGRQAARNMNAAETAYTFIGHVHHPILYFRIAGQNVARSFRPTPGTPIPAGAGLRRQWLAIVGSVGQPRDGNSAASYVIMDYAGSALTFHRVPYDYMTTATKILAAGLPKRLARRLEHGR